MTLKFKTNINCGGCKAKVSNFLDNESRIAKWEVDITNPDKVLQVDTDSMTTGEVSDLLRKAGYNAVPL
jgi:copper chaperone